MQKENKTITTPEGHKITFRDRKSVDLRLAVNPETMELLNTIAEKKGLSVESVVKFFISKGIRESEPGLSAKAAVERFNSRRGKEEVSSLDLAA